MCANAISFNSKPNDRTQQLKAGTVKHEKEFEPTHWMRYVCYIQKDRLGGKGKKIISLTLTWSSKLIRILDMEKSRCIQNTTNSTSTTKVRRRNKRLEEKRKQKTAHMELELTRKMGIVWFWLSWEISKSFKFGRASATLGRFRTHYLKLVGIHWNQLEKPRNDKKNVETLPYITRPQIEQASFCIAVNRYWVEALTICHGPSYRCNSLNKSDKIQRTWTKRKSTLI